MPTARLTHRWKNVPWGAAVPPGSKIRVCPLTEAVQARLRFAPIRYELYLKSDEAEDEDLEGIQQSFAFWKLQLHQTLRVGNFGF